jgi:hypothetical protein
MLPIGKVREVERLLAEGRLSQRKIAHVLGISRGVVSLIARGLRPDYEARQRDRDESAQQQGPIERCPGCGGRVYTPCRLCHVRKLQVNEKVTLDRLRRQARLREVKRILQAITAAARSQLDQMEAEDNPSQSAEAGAPAPGQLD